MAALVSNAVLGLVALVIVVGVQQQPVPVYADQSGVPVDATLTTRDGSPITNLYSYSSDGQPLSGVLVYDQDGRPVDNLATYDRGGAQVERALPKGAPAVERLPAAIARHRGPDGGHPTARPP